MICLLAGAGASSKEEDILLLKIEKLYMTNCTKILLLPLTLDHSPCQTGTEGNPFCFTALNLNTSVLQASVLGVRQSDDGTWLEGHHFSAQERRP